MTYCIVLTTCPTDEEARGLALKLVQEKLAACVQLSAVTSIYPWKCETHHEPEIRLMIKTRTGLYPAVEDFIRRNHSYEVPEIVQVPVTHGSDAYLAWMDENTIEIS
ncbi:MAG: divalent-cation tolerance protein CutA [Desulfobacula sp.]|nr:divalent-cation tolerance protein CutA [Desulfobacula sp.]